MCAFENAFSYFVSRQGLCLCHAPKGRLSLTVPADGGLVLQQQQQRQRRQASEAISFQRGWQASGHGHDIGSYCVIGDFPPIRLGGYLLLWHAYGTAATNMHIRGLGVYCNDNALPLLRPPSSFIHAFSYATSIGSHNWDLNWATANASPVSHSAKVLISFWLALFAGQALRLPFISFCRFACPGCQFVTQLDVAQKQSLISHIGWTGRVEEGGGDVVLKATRILFRGFGIYAISTCILMYLIGKIVSINISFLSPLTAMLDVPNCQTIWRCSSVRLPWWCRIMLWLAR